MFSELKSRYISRTVHMEDLFKSHPELNLENSEPSVQCEDPQPSTSGCQQNMRSLNSPQCDYGKMYLYKLHCEV